MNSNASVSISSSPRREIYRMRREAYRANAAGSCSCSCHKDESAAEIERLAQERDQWKDAVARAQADMANYRRRVERDREEANLQRAREVTLAVLPVLDNFERAIQASQGVSDAESVLKGVEMIRDQLRGALSGQGLQVVESMGQKFDPRLHEAIGVEEREDAQDGEVIDVLQEGFMMGEKLLRPAMVRVARNKK